MFYILGVIGSIILFLVITVLMISRTSLQKGPVPGCLVEKSKFEPVKRLDSHITVLNINLSFFYGLGNLQMSQDNWSQDILSSRVLKFAQKINLLDVDIIFVQEIDFFARRTFYKNQVDLILQKTHLNYAFPITSWNISYVPYPYWPATKHFGRTVSGGALLSKFPLTNLISFLLPKPINNWSIYNRFYPFRYYQFCDVILNSGKKLSLMNLHLEAFDRHNRTEQVEIISEFIQQRKPSLIAGDFNFLPPGAPSFIQSPKEDYFNSQDYDLFKATIGDNFRDSVTDEEYRNSHPSFFTFPGKEPNRKLDYQFYHSKELNLLKKEVIDLEVSDHLGFLCQYKILNDRSWW